MGESFRIGIIGNGNVSFHFNKWFKQAGHQITSIYSRHETKELTTKTNLDYQNETCDFIIIAVNDDVISEIVSAIKNVGNAIILHTSGTIPLSIFEGFNLQNYGVLYPLQTLQKNKDIALVNVPFLLESNHLETQSKLSMLCDTTNITYQFVDSTKRLTYHLAAVIASNFTNHLLSIADQVLKENDSNLDLLKPLIMETVQKAFELSPIASQTGPAKRQDHQTMQKHLDLLDSDRHSEIYELISQSIISEQQGKSE